MYQYQFCETSYVLILREWSSKYLFILIHLHTWEVPLTSVGLFVGLMMTCGLCLHKGAKGHKVVFLFLCLSYPSCKSQCTGENSLCGVVQVGMGKNWWSLDSVPSTCQLSWHRERTKLPQAVGWHTCKAKGNLGPNCDSLSHSSVPRLLLEQWSCALPSQGSWYSTFWISMSKLNHEHTAVQDWAFKNWHIYKWSVIFV